MPNKKDRFRSLLQDPKTAKIISEGLQAPPKSTKRKKAKALVSSAGLKKEDRRIEDHKIAEWIRQLKEQRGNKGGPGPASSGAVPTRENAQQQSNQSQDQDSNVVTTSPKTIDKSKARDYTELESSSPGEFFTEKGKQAYQKSKDLYKNMPPSVKRGAVDIMSDSVKNMDPTIASKMYEVYKNNQDLRKTLKGKSVDDPSLGAYAGETYKSVKNKSEWAARVWRNAPEEFQDKMMKKIKDAAAWSNVFGAFGPIGGVIDMYNKAGASADAIKALKEEAKVRREGGPEYAYAPTDDMFIDQYFGRGPRQEEQDTPQASTDMVSRKMERDDTTGAEPVQTQADQQKAEQQTGGKWSGDKNPKATSVGMIQSLLEKDDEFREAYTNMSDGQQQKVQIINEAIAKNLGPQAFANMAMSDKDVLKKLMPQVPEDKLPEGASMTGQISDMWKSMRKEYKLDRQFNDLMNMSRTSMNLDSKLQDYASSKNEYKKQIDSMIDDTREQMYEMDMSNPHNRKRMKNYLNYLHTLKGRQEKRLSGFLKDSVNQWNQKMKMKEKVYNHNKQLFNQEFKMKSAMTKERYKKLNSTLQSMYKSVKGREMDQIKKNTALLNMVKAQKELMGDTSQAAWRKKESEYAQEALIEGQDISKALNLSTTSVSWGEDEEQQVQLPAGSISEMTKAIQSKGVPGPLLLKTLKQKVNNSGHDVSRNAPEKTTKYFDHWDNMINDYFEKANSLNNNRQKAVQILHAKELADLLLHQTEQGVNKYVESRGKQMISELENWLSTGKGGNAFDTSRWPGYGGSTKDKRRALKKKTEAWVNSDNPIKKGLALHLKHQKDLGNYEDPINALLPQKEGSDEYVPWGQAMSPDRIKYLASQGYKSNFQSLFNTSKVLKRQIKN